MQNFWENDGAGVRDLEKAIERCAARLSFPRRSASQTPRLRTTIAGRYSDSRARGLRLTYFDAASQIFRSSACGIVRSRSPLRGSPGFTPGSRLSSTQLDVVSGAVDGHKIFLCPHGVNEISECRRGCRLWPKLVIPACFWRESSAFSFESSAEKKSLGGQPSAVESPVKSSRE